MGSGFSRFWMVNFDSSRWFCQFHLKGCADFVLFTISATGLVGKLGETSDKLGPIVGNQAQSSDRRATIRSRSGLSLTADGNSYCSFLLKNDLPSCKTSGHGNLSEFHPWKFWVNLRTQRPSTLIFVRTFSQFTSLAPSNNSGASVFQQLYVYHRDR